MKDTATRRVVLDTNACIPDYWWLSPHANAIREEAHSRHIQLVLPEIVRLELVNHYREDLERHKDRMAKVQRENDRLNLHIPAPAAFDLEAAVASFEDALRVFFSIGSTRIAPLPTVSHEALVQRALARRAPFGKDDRGYRDALVWHTALDEAEQGPVILVSNDRIFYDPSSVGSLAPELAAEMAASGHRHEIRLLPDLYNVYQWHRRPIEDARARLAERLTADPDYRDDLTERLINAAVFTELVHPPDELPSEAETPITIDWMDPLEPVTVQEVARMGHPGVLVEFRLNAAVEVGYSMHKSDYYPNEEKLGPAAEVNERYVSLSTSCELELRFLGDWDDEGQDVSNVDLVWAQEKDGGNLLTP